MSSNRQYNLDIIRIVACIFIVNFHFLGTTQRMDNIFYEGANGGMGIINVTIFYLLTGFLLRMNDKDVDTVTFYKKRAWSMYPMIICMFAIFYLIESIISHNFLYGGAPYKIIFSLLGIDGYLGWYNIKTYYVIGEWFTAVILVIYALYPAVRYLCKKINTYVIFAIITVLYVINNVFGIQSNMKPDSSIFTGLFVVMVGWILNYYVDVINRRRVVLIIVSAVVAAVCLFVPLPTVRGYHIFFANLCGLSIFVFMYCVFYSFNPKGWVARCVVLLSRLTYPIYLCHHKIMNLILVRVPHGDRVGLIKVYVLCIGVTLAVSLIVNGVINGLKSPLTFRKDVLK